MFAGCSSFNQPLEKWDVSKVTNMGDMFSDCSSFNQPLEKWDVSKVTYMGGMFHYCSSFNQPLGKWKIKTSVDDLDETAMSPSNYSQTLVGWAEHAFPSNLYFYVGGLFYNNEGKAARNKLISYGWKFDGDIHRPSGVAITPRYFHLVFNKEVTLPLWGVGKTEEVTLSTDTEGIISYELTEDKKGVRIKGLKEGKCKLTATIAGGYTNTCEIEVYVPIERIITTPASRTLKVGEEFTLTTNFLPENATKRTSFWNSSNSEIATVDDNGKVTAKKAGKCRIYEKIYEYGRWFYVKCEVTVVDEIAPVASITIPEKQTLMVGTPTPLIAVVKPYNAEQGLVWSSSDPETAMVSEGVVWGKKKGVCTITVKSLDPTCTITKECKITVEVPSFPVTLTQPTNGKIAIEGHGTETSIMVAQGTILTVTETPDEGYKLKKLTAGDKDITNTKQFTVTAATEVKAVFEKETFKLHENIVGTGALNFTDGLGQPLDPTAVPYGMVVRVIPVSNAPWELVSLMAGTEDITPTQSFILKSEVTVYAVFQNKNVTTFRVTVTQTEGGTIAIPGYTTEALKKVSKDTELTVTVTPDEGYKLKTLTAGDEDITNTKQFIVKADTEVKAVFEKETFKLHKNIVGTGSLNFTDADDQPLDPAAVPYGTTVKFVPVENDPWELVSLMAGTEDITTTQSFVLKGEVTVYAVFQNKTVPTFKVTVTQTEGGTIAIPGYTTAALEKVSKDTELTVTVTPDTEHGYKLKELKANDTDITATKQFIVKEDTEVKAVFELLTFQITPDVTGEGCSLTFKNADTDATITDLGAVPYGTVVRVVPVENAPWELKVLSANGKDIFAAKEFTIKEATTVKAVFKKPLPKFTVTLTQPTNGKIAIEGHATETSITVEQGTTLTVTETPDEGYKLKELKAGEEDITNSKQFTVTAATEVKAVFEKQTFTVKASFNDEKGGEIAISGATDLTAVPYGTELTVTATEKEGYKLKELRVNGKKIEGTTFVVKAATTVTAVFEKQTFVVTTSVNDEKGGSIELTGASNLKAVAYGTELTVKVTEKEGYKLKSLTVGDEDITNSKQFTVKAATTVTAIFESKQGGAVEDALLAGIVVAPNPFTAQLRILNPEGVAARYEVVNAAGMVVRSGALSGSEAIVDTEALPSGIYFVRLEAQNGARKNLVVSK